MTSDEQKHALTKCLWPFHHSNAYFTSQAWLNMTTNPPPSSITHAFFDRPTVYGEGKSRLNSTPLAEVVSKKAAGSK